MGFLILLLLTAAHIQTLPGCPFRFNYQQTGQSVFASSINEANLLANQYRTSLRYSDTEIRSELEVLAVALQTPASKPVMEVPAVAPAKLRTALGLTYDMLAELRQQFAFDQAIAALHSLNPLS